MHCTSFKKVNTYLSFHRAYFNNGGSNDGHTQLLPITYFTLATYLDKL